MTAQNSQSDFDLTELMAMSRYVHDAEFYNAVNKAVEMGVPEHFDPTIQQALRESGKMVASLALIIFEEMEPKKRYGGKTHPEI